MVGANILVHGEEIMDLSNRVDFVNKPLQYKENNCNPRS